MEPPTEVLSAATDARHHVSALYQAHALALVKLAVLMTGDQPTAEDVVQDAFLGLYRRWQSLHDVDKALPPRQREAVVLRYYLDMTEEQTAQAMGVGRGTVKSATHRGIAALARMLKEGDAR